MILAKILSNRAQRRKDKYMNEKSDNALSEYKWGNIGKCNYSDELKEFVNMEVMEYGIISITEDDKLPPEERAPIGSYNWGIDSPTKYEDIASKELEYLSEKLCDILQKYKGRAEDYHETIDTLFKKGVLNGCYQDYELLIDTISILTLFERALKKYHN